MTIKNARTRVVSDVLKEFKSIKKRGAKLKRKRRPAFMTEAQTSPIEKWYIENGYRLPGRKA
jgi:hypothetical protein